MKLGLQLMKRHNTHNHPFVACSVLFTQPSYSSTWNISIVALLSGGANLGHLKVWQILKVSVWSPDIGVTTHVLQTLGPLAVAHSSLQLLIQTWICAPGTHCGLVDWGIMEYEVCPTPLHMASTGNRTSDLMIWSPTPNPIGHICSLTNTPM